jgi:hypothetical protein
MAGQGDLIKAAKAAFEQTTPDVCGVALLVKWCGVAHMYLARRTAPALRLIYTHPGSATTPPGMELAWHRRFGGPIATRRGGCKPL